MYFKITEAVPPGTVKKIKFVEGGFAEKPGNYGPQYIYQVEMDKKKLAWFATANQHSNIQASVGSPGVGTELWIKGWAQGTKRGWNYSATPIAEDEQGVDKPGWDNDDPFSSNGEAPTEEFTPQTPAPDDFQTKVSRGASFNAACYYSIYKASGGPLLLPEWLKSVTTTAEKITEIQSKFVNNHQ